MELKRNVVSRKEGKFSRLLIAVRLKRKEKKKEKEEEGREKEKERRGEESWRGVNR